MSRKGNNDKDKTMNRNATPGTIDMATPVLCRYDTGDPIRNATAEELAESIAAADNDGGAGVIEIDGRSCYVVE